MYILDINVLENSSIHWRIVRRNDLIQRKKVWRRLDAMQSLLGSNYED